MEFVSGKVSLRKIFLCRKAWLIFWTANVLRLRWGVVWNVGRMLLCRTGWGYKEYRCPQCSFTRRVPHTCKSRFCSSCGKAATDRWVEQTLSEFLDVPYQHLVFTLPCELRDWIQFNRKAALDALFQALHHTLLTFTQQRGYRPGILSVLHTFGGDLKWNPHFHVVITCGGLSKQQDRWITNTYLHHACIRPMWRYAVLQSFKELFKAGRLKSPPLHRAIRDYNAFNSYLTQFYQKEWYVFFGHSLEDVGSTVRYVGRYGKRPVLAEHRIEAFDGSSVTFRYKDRATGEDASLTLPVQEFIARLVQHIPDQHFRQTRYAGIFATRIRSKALPLARLLLGQTSKPPPQPLLYRDLFEQTFHCDPLLCPQCRVMLVLGSVLFVSSREIRSRVSARDHLLRKHAHGTPTPAPFPSPAPPLRACASP